MAELAGHRGPSGPAPTSPDLGRELLDVRHRIAASKRQLEQDEALLSEVRKRVQVLRTELSRDQDREGQLVQALGGKEQAAAVAAAVAAAAAPAPPLHPASAVTNGGAHMGHLPLQSMPHPTIPGAVVHMIPIDQLANSGMMGHSGPMVVPPGMIVQHLPPGPPAQQPAVVVYHSQGQPGLTQQHTQQVHVGQGHMGQHPPAQQLAQHAQQQPEHAQQAPKFLQHPSYPVRSEAWQAAEQQLYAAQAQRQAMQQQHNGAAVPAPAGPAPRPPRPGPPPGFSAAPGRGGGGLAPHAQEFVPRALQLQVAAQQQAQQLQPPAAEPAQPVLRQHQASPAAEGQPSAADDAFAVPVSRQAGSGAPPGFPGVAAQAQPRTMPVQASPLAAFPVPGRGPQPAAPQPVQQPAQHAQQARPAAARPDKVRQNGGHVGPLPSARPDADTTANDAALAAALADSEEEAERLSSAMESAGLGGRAGSGVVPGPAATAARGWGRGGGGARAGETADARPGSAHGFSAAPAPRATTPVPVEEDFPSLAAAATPAASGPRGWGNAKATQQLRSMLAVGAPAGPAGHAQQQQAPSAEGAAAVEEAEVRSGLRSPGDATPDAERRRLVRRQTFQHNERSIKTRQPVDVTGGLELHRDVLSPAEQALVVETVEHWVALGKTGHLRGRTFSAPKKWLPGKGRMTMQFGCCYNYARDSQGRDPGIIPEEVVEPMPPLLRALCARLVRWGVLPRSREPDSAIINIYEEGDCIPPHVDHHDFIRPFCTLSLVSEQSIMFGQRLVPAGPGEFVAQGGEPAYIPLPTGSCLVLKGYGGDQAMHCVPPVDGRRISITLRKMGTQHEAAVLRELKQLEAQGCPVRGFWEDHQQGGRGAGRARAGGGAIVIK